MLFAQTVVSQPSFFGAAGFLPFAVTVAVLVLLAGAAYRFNGIGTFVLAVPAAGLMALLALTAGVDGLHGDTVPRSDIAQVYEISEADLPSSVSVSQSPFTLPDGRQLVRADLRDNATSPGIHWTVQ